MIEQTLGIIKPDGVARNLTGEILSRITSAGLRIRGLRMTQLSKKQAEGFYAVHRSRPFFDSLTFFMSEGPVVLMVITGENAIRVWRDLMGATDPAKAADGTIRRQFGQSIERNTTHGSDSPESAVFEVGYFFSGHELCNGTS